MPARTVYTCDGCGVERQQTNHWWSVWIDHRLSTHPEFMIRPMELNGTGMFYCGQACVVKALSEWFGRMKQGIERAEVKFPLDRTDEYDERLKEGK